MPGKQNPDTSHPSIWTVSDLTEAIKNNLQAEFHSLTVTGEVSNLHKSAAGHMYFTLKDSRAAISAVFFKYSQSGSKHSSSLEPTDGMKLELQGHLDVYAPRGQYQIIVQSLKKQGRGTLLEELEQLKIKLAAEGLFDTRRKQPLPQYPTSLAIITSPTGAALQDVLKVLSRRSSVPGIRIAPATVQGDTSAAQIVRQIQRAARYQLGDIILLARGGGSLEDLSPFNDERVVRAIAQCPIPIICGVGHETDTTLCDLAADVRAETPSAAAELISANYDSVHQYLDGFRRESSYFMTSRLETLRLTLRSLHASQFKQQLENTLNESRRRTDEAAESLYTQVKTRITACQQRLQLALRTLTAASPRSILEQGYAWVQGPRGHVNSTQALAPNDQVSVTVRDGSFLARVTELAHSDPAHSDPARNRSSP